VNSKSRPMKMFESELPFVPQTIADWRGNLLLKCKGAKNAHEYNSYDAYSKDYKKHNRVFGGELGKKLNGGFLSREDWTNAKTGYDSSRQKSRLDSEISGNNPWSDRNKDNVIAQSTPTAKKKTIMDSGNPSNTLLG